MLTEPERFSQLRWLNTVVSVLAILGGLVLVVAGLAGADPMRGVLMTVAGAFLLFFAVMLMAFMALAVKIESTLARQLGELRHLKEALNKQAPALNSIAENTRISDAAKSLAHRDVEVEALRTAIHDDIRKERWEAGLSLIDKIEREFGFKEEADAIREELDEARRRVIQTKLGKAIERIEVHFQAHGWDLATSEIDRLANALPGDAKVAGLADRMKMLKEEHKSQLLKEWDEAVRRSDTDRAIEVLRDLDQYLSSAEAHELQATARDVFKVKLLQLGTQFQFAVTEKRWHDALTAGLELVRSFPNARMASEVREALDTLRERAKRASEPRPAETAPSP